MGTPEPRIRIEISSKALLHNLRIIQDLVPHQAILPMIKANSYGHGIEWATRILSREKIYGLGVATLEEGAQVSKLIKPAKPGLPVIIFSGSAPWTEEKGDFCLKYGLRPVISSFEDFKAFHSRGWTRRLDYDLKFDTGMHRLGIALEDQERALKTLFSLASSELPKSVLTHLAVGEKPDHPVSRSQKKRTHELQRRIKAFAPRICFHFANSAAIWNQRPWRVEEISDLVRPGISLYGVRPWAEAQNKNLIPVMQVFAPVIARKILKAKESIGYGACFKARRKENIALLSIGYADGLHRYFSGHEGYVNLRGKRVPLLGTLSMDLSAIRCPPDCQVGEWVEVLGAKHDIWHQARAAGTIPYELLTSASVFDPARVKRSYV